MLKTKIDNSINLKSRDFEIHIFNRYRQYLNKGNKSLFGTQIIFELHAKTISPSLKPALCISFLIQAQITSISGTYELSLQILMKVGQEGGSDKIPAYSF